MEKTKKKDERTKEKKEEINSEIFLRNLKDTIDEPILLMHFLTKI
jgi:hypothetical protein